MNYYNSEHYLKDLELSLDATKGLEGLFGTSVLIAGGSGLIGSFIVDMLLLCNLKKNANITVYAMDLSIERLTKRFEGNFSEKLHLIEHDVNNAMCFDFSTDYIIHAASPAFPAAFNSNPVGTVLSNILGTKHLLDYGKEHCAKRLLYISSGEVYGQGNLEIEAYPESYSGYVDPTSVRACYPNGKRAAETLCVSFSQQYGLDSVIVRPSHTYGPTVTSRDNRANAQFVNKGLAGEDIILTSTGEQMRSYTYLADTASAILTVLMCGESCNAYNIACPKATISVAGFAMEVAAQTGTKVVFCDASDVERKERTPITRQVLNSQKIESLGWHGQFGVPEGISHTLAIMRDIQ